MTPQQRYALVEAAKLPLGPNPADVKYLLARIRRAEELLRDASVVYEAHFMTEDHAEIDTFLAGDPPTTV